jgi:hypothetical protein
MPPAFLLVSYLGWGPLKMEWGSPPDISFSSFLQSCWNSCFGEVLLELDWPFPFPCIFHWATGIILLKRKSDQVTHLCSKPLLVSSLPRGWSPNSLARHSWPASQSLPSLCPALPLTSWSGQHTFFSAQFADPPPWSPLFLPPDKTQNLLRLVFIISASCPRPWR